MIGVKLFVLVLLVIGLLSVQGQQQVRVRVVRRTIGGADEGMKYGTRVALEYVSRVNIPPFNTHTELQYNFNGLRPHILEQTTGGISHTITTRRQLMDQEQHYRDRGYTYEVLSTFHTPVNVRQLNKIVNTMHRYKYHTYHVCKTNCIDFVDDLSQDLQRRGRKSNAWRNLNRQNADIKNSRILRIALPALDAIDQNLPPKRRRLANGVNAVRQKIRKG